MLAQQGDLIQRQNKLLAKAQVALTEFARANLRAEPQWVQERAIVDKRKCLRHTFVNGTVGVETSVFSQVGEDGIIDAIFKCIGHRDKCALVVIVRSVYIV